MANITTLKLDIQFNNRLGGLLNALKSIAAQQYQALERVLRSNPVFFDAIHTIAAGLELRRVAHPFTDGGEPIGVIAVTSDTGLLGGLNQQVISVALQEFRQAPGELMVVGERGVAAVKDAKLSCTAFPGASDHGRRALASRVCDYALSLALAGRIRSLTIVHPRSLSFTLQRIEVIRVLPCTSWLRTAGRAPSIGPAALLVLESPLAGLIEYLVWLWLGEKLVDVLGSSRLAELGARSIHLEGSSQELQRRGKKLMLRYFRERRELIDRNIRELFAAKSLYGR